MPGIRNKFLMWAEPIGAVASVVIAVMAVLITMMLDEEQIEREESARRFAKTAAINATYASLDSMQELSDYAHKLLYVMGTVNVSGPDEYWVAYAEQYDKLTLGVTPNRQERFLDRQASLMNFVLFAQDIYSCGWQSDDDGQTACEKDTLLEATVPDLAWIHYGNLHGLYCDERMVEQFLRDETDTSPLYNLETMIMDSTQLAFEALGQSVPVFRSYAERGDRFGRYVRPNLDALCKAA